MFYLSLIEHTLRLPPQLLGLPLNEAIKGELESLFVDKVRGFSIAFAFSFCYCEFRVFKRLKENCVVMQVIANLGLCVSVYDIRSIDGGFVFPGDGASTYTVYFIIYLSGMLSK